MLKQKVKYKPGIWNVIISIILETPDHTEIQNRQYCNTVKTVEAVLSVLSFVFFMYAIYWLMLIGCALSDQCYNAQVGY